MNALDSLLDAADVRLLDTKAARESLANLRHYVKGLEIAAVNPCRSTVRVEFKRWDHGGSPRWIGVAHYTPPIGPGSPRWGTGSEPITDADCRSLEQCRAQAANWIDRGLWRLTMFTIGDDWYAERHECACSAAIGAHPPPEVRDE